MSQVNPYIGFLIGDLEYFLISNRNEINPYVEKNRDIPYEKSLEILDKFNETLKKATNLMRLTEEINDEAVLRDIFILTSESLAWILFTLPTISDNLPIFVEELNIGGESIFDLLGQHLLQLEMYIDKPSLSKATGRNVYQGISDIHSTLDAIVKQIKRGAVEN